MGERFVYNCQLASGFLFLQFYCNHIMALTASAWIHVSFCLKFSSWSFVFVIGISWYCLQNFTLYKLNSVQLLTHYALCQFLNFSKNHLNQESILNWIVTSRIGIKSNRIVRQAKIHIPVYNYRPSYKRPVDVTPCWRSSSMSLEWLQRLMLSSHWQNHSSVSSVMTKIISPSWLEAIGLLSLLFTSCSSLQ